MALIKCKACGNELSENAEKCPKCGEPSAKAKSVSSINAIAGLAIAGLVIWFFFGGGIEQQTDKEMQRIGDQVANDAVDQYNIAKRSGDLMQICVHAGIVSAAYLQAKDEANYQLWKETETSECKAAGMPN
jgi:hypothetical protein